MMAGRATPDGRYRSRANRATGSKAASANDTCTRGNDQIRIHHAVVGTSGRKVIRTRTTIATSTVLATVFGARSSVRRCCRAAACVHCNRDARDAIVPRLRSAFAVLVRRRQAAREQSPRAGSTSSKSADGRRLPRASGTVAARIAGFSATPHSRKAPEAMGANPQETPPRNRDQDVPRRTGDSFEPTQPRPQPEPPAPEPVPIPEPTPGPGPTNPIPPPEPHHSAVQLQRRTLGHVPPGCLRYCLGRTSTSTRTSGATFEGR